MRAVYPARFKEVVERRREIEERAKSSRSLPESLKEEYKVLNSLLSEDPEAFRHERFSFEEFVGKGPIEYLPYLHFDKTYSVLPCFVRPQKNGETPKTYFDEQGRLWFVFPKVPSFKKYFTLSGGKVFSVFGDLASPFFDTFTSFSLSCPINMGKLSSIRKEIYHVFSGKGRYPPFFVEKGGEELVVEIERDQYPYALIPTEGPLAPFFDLEEGWQRSGEVLFKIVAGISTMEELLKREEEFGKKELVEVVMLGRSLKDVPSLKDLKTELF